MADSRWNLKATVEFLLSGPEKLREAAGLVAATAEKASSASTRLAAMNERLEESGRSASQASRGFRELADVSERVGTRLSVGVTLPVLAMGRGILDNAIRMDSLKRALEATTGSAEETARQLGVLHAVANNPGISFETAVRGSLRLQQAGRSAKDAERDIAAWGKAVSLSAGGPRELNLALVQLSQMLSKGKVEQEDLRPIQEQVVGLGKAMKTLYGTSDAEIIGKKGVTAGKFMSDVTKYFEGMKGFADSAGNAVQTLQAKWEQAQGKLGESMLPTLIEAANKLSGAVETVSNAFAALPTSVQGGVFALALTAAAAGPILIVTSQVIQFRVALATLRAMRSGGAERAGELRTEAAAAGQATAAVQRLAAAEAEEAMVGRARSGQAASGGWARNLGAAASGGLAGGSERGPTGSALVGGRMVAMGMGEKTAAVAARDAAELEQVGTKLVNGRVVQIQALKGALAAVNGPQIGGMPGGMGSAANGLAEVERVGMLRRLGGGASRGMAKGYQSMGGAGGVLELVGALAAAAEAVHAVSSGLQETRKWKDDENKDGATSGNAGRQRGEYNVSVRVDGRLSHDVIDERLRQFALGLEGVSVNR